MKNNLKITAALLAIIALSPILSKAENFKMPRMPEREIRVTEIHYEGKKIDPDTASLSQKLLWLGSPKRLESDFYWVGTGADRHPEFIMVERLNNKNTVTNTYKFKPGKHLVIATYERIEKSPNGRQLRREFYNIAHPDNNYSEDLMHSYTLELAFRGLPLDKPGSKHEYNIWLPPGMIIPMVAKVRGKETLDTPMGKRECYKVEIAPNMSKFLGPILGRLVQPLIPKYRFWFDVNGTHPILRYIGPLGKVNIIGVPDEVYVIISLDPDPSK